MKRDLQNSGADAVCRSADFRSDLDPTAWWTNSEHTSLEYDSTKNAGLCYTVLYCDVPCCVVTVIPFSKEANIRVLQKHPSLKFACLASC